MPLNLTKNLVIHNMMETSHLMYYMIKRLFLFLDEWLFYVVLYKLYKGRHYKIWMMVLLYGGGCIYTSYSNISILERRIIDEDQSFFLVTMESMKSFITNFWAPRPKKLKHASEDKTTK